MNIMKLLIFVRYNLVAKHLPCSYSRIKIGQKSFRAWCGKRLLQSCGKEVNIESGAVFATTVKLGNRSGIGAKCVVSLGTIIGDNVMMGPECLIYTRNHKFS